VSGQHLTPLRPCSSAENEKMKREAQEWSGRMEQLAQKHQQQLNSREEELRKISSEKSGLTGVHAYKSAKGR